MRTLKRPFTALWGALVAWQRDRLDDDPDVRHIRQQRREAEHAVARFDVTYRDFNRAAFGRDPWPRNERPRP